MPFDFKNFDAKCANMSIDELQREWEHYTRLISGSATSTAVSGVAIPFTLGVSAIGVGLAAPAIHNARKKREIIERHLQRLGTTHHTRKRDVLTLMAISGTVGLVTLGVASGGAGAITNAAVEHGITSIAANEIAVEATVHLAVGGVAMAGEEHHMQRMRQQAQKRVCLAEKITQPTISIQNHSGIGDQTQVPVSTGHCEDFKYDYSTVPLSTPISGSIPPPYSPPAHEQNQNYAHLQQYSENPSMGEYGLHHPIPPQKYVSDTKYHASSTEPPQTRPQPYPVQSSPGFVMVPSVEQGQQQMQTLYPQQNVLQAPQMMYPSYPTSVIPNSAHEQYAHLDQVMSELSISSLQSTSAIQVTSPVSRLSTPKPPARTSRGYCSQPHQTIEHSSLHFSLPSPLSPVSPLCYSQSSNITSLVCPVDQQEISVIQPRSPPLSPVNGYQPFPPGQQQPTSLNQYGYMTPAPTPGYEQAQASSQTYSSTFCRYQNLNPPLPQMPAAVQLHMSERPKSTQTSQYSHCPPPQDYFQSPQQRSSYI